MSIFTVKKFSIVSMLMILTSFSGCETISSAIEFETTSTVEEVTTSEVTTIEQTTTRKHNYEPNMTVCSVYTPNTETTPSEDTTSEEITTPNDETILTTDTSFTTTIDTDKKYHYNSSATTTDIPLVDGSYFFQDCAFIGDSLTVALSMYELIPKDYTFAQEGISISGMNSLQLYTNYGYNYPAQAISYWQPKHIYIMLGINGVSWISNDKAIESYKQLIESILSYNVASVEDINIISVLPVSHSKEIIDTVENGRILNSEIDALNSKLETMAKSYNLNYIDANSKLKDTSTGCLPDEFTVDGIHLTKSGYEMLIQTLIDDVNNSN